MTDCEHISVCDYCEVEPEECVCYEKQVDRAWLMAVAQLMGNEKEWETDSDYEKAKDFAEQICNAIGFDMWEVLETSPINISDRSKTCNRELLFKIADDLAMPYEVRTGLLMTGSSNNVLCGEQLVNSMHDYDIATRIRKALGE